MNKQETIQVIALLAGNYNNIAEKTKEQKSVMVNTWYECLNDLDYKLVLSAVKKTIIESPYPPTIHDIRKNAIEIMNPTKSKNPMEAWQEAYKMICSGTYMTQEQFNQHTEEVRKFFGNVEHLRSYSTNEDFNIDVVRSNFLKQYDRIEKETREWNMLPDKMKELIINTGLLNEVN
jgi:hypothetical protein